MDSISETWSPDDGDVDCIPKIINTVSLQDCPELSFKEEPVSDAANILYPQLEIKEEKDKNKYIKPEAVENGLSLQSKDNEGESEKEKKRIALTHLPKTKQEREIGLKASTSRKNDVVDSKTLDLQGSLLKTKELFDVFLRVCQDHENTEQMEKVVEKLSRAYDATKQDYLGSLVFQNILETETEKVNTSSSKPWLNMKLVLDELKHNKKNCSTKLKLGESEGSENDGDSNDDEPIIECPKKRRHLKKLEKVLRAINLKIKKLEEREVDWEEEDNSAYCKLDRYRAQFTKIYTKICEIKGKLPDADRPYLRKVSFAGTTYPHINRCIEKFYNKHREFPDFQDIKKLVTHALKQEGIEMPPIKIHSMAAAAFKEFGEMLKRLRQYDDYDVLVSYLDEQVDPAKDNQELQEQLNMNALLFKKREQEVLDKFAERESVRDFGSESDEDSDSKPKKKKRKIILNDPSEKKMSSSVKPNLSSDEDSEEENCSSTPNPRLSLSSDSDNCESDSEEKKGKKSSSSKKGKALIGKQRIVKKGVKKCSPIKSEVPKTSISSDEEVSPRNTKESLTSYLGLKGKCPVTAKESKTKEHDETNKQNNQNQNQLKGTQNLKISDSESTDIDKPSKVKIVQTGSQLISAINHFSGHQDSKKLDTSVNTIIDSDSDVEPIAIIKEPKKCTEASSKTQVRNQARKKTGPVTKRFIQKHPSNHTRTLTREAIVDNMIIGVRTSGRECGSEINKRLSDEEFKVISDEDIGTCQDILEPIVVLSEDSVQPKATAPKPSGSTAQDSSDDDVCILSQSSTEMRTVAPRKMKPTGTTVLVRNPTSIRAVTSTPNKICQTMMNQRLPKNDQATNQNYLKRKLNVITNGSSKQQTTLHTINGASRKVLGRLTKPENSNQTTSNSIPLIELD